MRSKTPKEHKENYNWKTMKVALYMYMFWINVLKQIYREKCVAAIEDAIPQNRIIDSPTCIR